MYQDVAEVIGPGSQPAQGVGNRPREVQERSRRIVAEHGADRAQIVDRRVPKDDLAVVVQKPAAEGRQVDEKSQGRRDNRRAAPPGRGRVGRR